MATEDARYRQSTQYRLWSFSPGKLASLRAQTNELAAASISARLAAARSSGSGANSDSGNGNGSGSVAATPAPLPDFLTPADEHQLLTFYTVMLLKAATFCELSSDARASAAVLLKRFYVTNSIMTYPPSTMIKTALFFGAKAEGHYLRVGRIADRIKGTTPEEILAGEFLLCEGVRFAFDVRHPFRALQGAFMQLRRCTADLDDDARLGRAHDRAGAVLRFSSLVTDVYFHYTPSQIMMAALSIADHGLLERLIQETFKRGGGSSSSTATPLAEDGAATPATTADGAAAVQPGGKPARSGRAKKSELERERIFGAEVREKVLATIAACRKMLETEPPEREDEYYGTPHEATLFKPLQRKLKKCRDPDRHDLVALQKARRERALNSIDSDDEGPGARPGAKKATVEDDGAVFGGPMLAAAAAGDSSRDPKRRKVSNDPFGPPL
ncbi:hypothetical protein GGTG_06562 [Gaeumannomyces tritici R3-111a-1]|uniref:Cyclin C-terminal domain-containing protein n=1 Tax=Gaeumannomyces tritici (strain R3-111a-1) TaxID=644352 RepID=J3NZ62_GAET3|nr:hypothetical protein GGTG_06562 [Gaeumannomyces tritici R3-111a-1]EJT76645.1 hypothetical protein GGTG_06562 [Gaeumannomyces tritici R3-111a-1]